MPVPPFPSRTGAATSAAPVDLFGALRADAARAELSLVGEIDIATASRFAALVGAAVEMAPTRLVVDLSGVTYMGACAIPVLESAASRLAAHGGTVELRNTATVVLRLFKAGGLDASIGVEPATTDDGAVARWLVAGAVPQQRRVLDAALTLVVVMTQALVRSADGVSITLPRHGRLGTVAASNDVVLEMDHDQYDTDEGPCLDAARQGQPFESEVLGTELRWPDFVPRARARGIECILSTPLLEADRPLGALNMYSRTADAFEAHEKQWAAQFAEEAARVVSVALAADPGAGQDEFADELEKALASRQQIALAQGILVGRYGGTADGAYELLRETSILTARPLRELCEELVESRTSATWEDPRG